MPEQPQDLAQHDCLGYRNFSRHSGGRHIWHLSHATEPDCAIDVSCRLTANEVTALMAAACEGMGIALQPTYLVAEKLRNGELVQVLPDWKPDDLKIYVLYASRKHQSAAVRAVIDYLQEWFQEREW